MKSAFDMKSARIDALAVCLHTANLEELEAFLQERTGRYQAFTNMPFVLDLQEFISADALNINGAVSMLKRHGINITALRHNDEAFASAAGKNHLAFVVAKRNNATETDTLVPEPTKKEKAPNNNQAMQTTIINQPTVLVNTPIRTGQQVYAESADLIVTGVVSEGAEIIADGNIHVYGPMRGRALAGAAGNRNARIFIHSMQAELVSVAGIYRNFEQDLPAHLHKQAVQISLQNDRLAISAIDTDSSY